MVHVEVFRERVLQVLRIYIVIKLKLEVMFSVYMYCNLTTRISIASSNKESQHLLFARINSFNKIYSLTYMLCEPQIPVNSGSEQ